MKQPINEIERLKLIAGLINEVNYNDTVYGVNRNTKTTLTEAKEEKVLSIDVANPYEFRHGLQYELDQMDDYSDEALEKAKVKVLKNLTKDTNFYFNLLNQQPTGFEFKETETNAPGMQANADGTLKKGAGKLEKANVKDSLGKSEAAKGKPKDVKEMPDKGVEGKEKVVKEGLEVNSTKSYHGSTANQGDTGWTIDFTVIENTPEYFKIDYVMTPNSGRAPMGASRNYKPEKKYGEWKISKVGDDGQPLMDWEKSQINIKGDRFSVNGKEFVSDIYGGVNEDNMESNPANGDSSAEGQFNQLMSKYDWYHEMSDDPRKWDTGSAMDQKLKSLAKTIGIDRAVELFNDKAPSDRKVTTTFFAEGKDKHAKLKEMLKAGLKKRVSEEATADETAKKSAIQTEKAKLIALNKQKSELLADKNKPKEVKDAEMKGITLKLRAAQDNLNKLNSGKVSVV
jgi:hypothetical protein